MNKRGILVVCLVMSATVSASVAHGAPPTAAQAMEQARAFGAVANEGVAATTKSTDPARIVPSYQGTNVPETGLYDEGLNIENRGIEALPNSAVGSYVRETANTRPRIQLDPETDPLLTGGKRIMDDPESVLGHTLSGQYSGCRNVTTTLAPETFTTEYCTSWGRNVESTCSRTLDIDVDQPPPIIVGVLDTAAFVLDVATITVNLQTGDILSARQNKYPTEACSPPTCAGPHCPPRPSVCPEFWVNAIQPLTPPPTDEGQEYTYTSSCTMRDTGSVVSGSYDATATCRITQQPSEENGWVAVIELDDDSGDSWYRYGARFVFQAIQAPEFTERWTDGCAAVRNDKCEVVSPERCVEPNETRVFAGIPIQKECWRYETGLSCVTTNLDEEPYCQELRDRGCSQIASECSSRTDAGECIDYQQAFRCPNGDEVTQTTLNCGDQTYCLDGNCFDASYEPSQDFALAVSHLGAAEAVAKDFDKENLSIFAGESLRCGKTQIGFSNCCRDSGWGVDIGLSQCSEQEKLLGMKRQSGQCHYVGSYKRGNIFNRRKYYRYCCFNSKLARIIQQQGRAQLGIGWGSARNPSCRGFTPDELTRIDFSRIDFSEFYADAMQKGADGVVPDTGLLREMIERRIRLKKAMSDAPRGR